MEAINTVTIMKPCPRCHKVQTYEFDEVGLTKWRNRDDDIQTCLPNISPDAREFLLTGICSTCWDKIFEKD